MAEHPELVDFGGQESRLGAGLTSCLQSAPCHLPKPDAGVSSESILKMHSGFAEGTGKNWDQTAVRGLKGQSVCAK